MKAKHPDRSAIIVDAATNIKLDKSKYLVPNDLTVGQFLMVLRKRIKLNEHEALYIYCHNYLLRPSLLISQVEHSHKDVDGFVYFHLRKEATFGLEE